jgi:putative oxidoreductase
MPDSSFQPFRSCSDFPTLWEEVLLQRLFSNFANGWPGRGLLVQRALTAAVLTNCVVSRLTEASWFAALPELIAAGLGIFVLMGLWTPVVGTLVGLTECWILLLRPTGSWISLILATLGITLAMIGPGAWSVDARLFGRKRIETSKL